MVSRPDDFAKKWQSSLSIDDAILKLGWKGTRRSLISTASQLRKKGIPLKRFKDRVVRPATPAETPRDQFIRVWQTSASIPEVAARLGLSYDRVILKASRLRDEGCYLRRFLRASHSTPKG